MRECLKQWPANECKVRPTYSQQMVAERKADKPKTTQKGKEYDLMMPIYIYRRLRPAVAFNVSVTNRLPGDFNHRDDSRARA